MIFIDADTNLKSGSPIAIEGNKVILYLIYVGNNRVVLFFKNTIELYDLAKKGVVITTNFECSKKFLNERTLVKSKRAIYYMNGKE